MSLLLRGSWKWVGVKEFGRTLLGLGYIILEGRIPERKTEVRTSWEEMYKSRNAYTKRIGKLKGLSEGEKKN